MSYLFYVWKLLKLSCEIITNLLCISGKISVKQLVYFCKCCCTAYRMSTKGCSVRTCGKCFGNFCCCTDCTDRHSAAKCFSHRNDIRLDAVVHVAHYSSGSAPSCLNLINKEEHALLITELAKSLHEFRCCRMNAALALYRLNHDSDCVLCASILESL